MWIISQHVHQFINVDIDSFKQNRSFGRKPEKEFS